MLLDLLILGVALLTLCIVITAVAHIWVAVPFIPTPHVVVEEMLTLAALTGKETVYDLGAGDARLLIAAKRRFPGIRAIGVELVPTVWLLGKLRILFSREEVVLRFNNALTENVSDADCIFLYLIPSLMQKLEAKFDRELRPGTTVISYAFPFPGRTPVKEKLVPWLTGKRNVRVYQW